MQCPTKHGAPFGGAAVGVGAAGGGVALDVDQVEVADGGQHVARRPRQRQALRRRRAARLRAAQPLAEHVGAQQLVLGVHIQFEGLKSVLVPPGGMVVCAQGEPEVAWQFRCY